MRQSISIHALLAESDGSAWVQEFPELYISIHALLAESDALSHSLPALKPHISIHALLAESDNGFAGVLFLIDISIHALLAESDRCLRLSGRCG